MMNVSNKYLKESKSFVRYLLKHGLFLFVFTFGPNTLYAESIRLESRSCSGTNIENQNMSILLSAIASGKQVVLPSGEFRIAELSVSNIENGTLQGATDSSTGEPLSKLVFPGANGLTLSNVSNFQLLDLDILGSSGGSLVVLENAGDFSAINLRILERTSSDSNMCLSYNLDWLVPVLHILL